MTRRLTFLERCVLSWLRNREEMPSQKDLCAEFPDNQEQTLLRIMSQLVERGLAEKRGLLWMNSGDAR